MLHDQTFGNRVRELLETRKLSSRALSERAYGRISNTTVLNMQKGHVPSSDVIVEFAQALAENPAEVASVANELLSLADKSVRYHQAEPKTGGEWNSAGSEARRFRAGH
jgi:hypothetical protein